jgi:hypothetical protein
MATPSSHGPTNWSPASVPPDAVLVGWAAGPVEVVVEPVEAVVVVELVVDDVDEVVDDVAGMNSVGGGATVVEVDVVVFCSWNLA